jgi:hypothetical protein
VRSPLKRNVRRTNDYDERRQSLEPRCVGSRRCFAWDPAIARSLRFCLYTALLRMVGSTMQSNASSGRRFSLRLTATCSMGVTMLRRSFAQQLMIHSCASGPMRRKLRQTASTRRWSLMTLTWSLDSKRHTVNEPSSSHPSTTLDWPISA